jgi:nanoRNase/pAp phosphatase (c-di-AMP/oligoRNAs hydrolase)
MDQQKQSIADRLKQSNNILVTVSNNPSVDQLASCIGLTLALNKMGKHATAVFSGAVPNTIEFLQPEKTIEKNTDSLRDFIIALDKAKADKLRYKVEDKVVKIFITPYKTSITEKDLEFSQGDFNVDVVVALGVHQQSDLDQAITAHGRILHDATVVTINTKPGGELGTLNWLDSQASSLSELVVELLDVVDKDLMDGQMATAFLTGIVAETNRFSNEKTTPTTMSISAELMVAGANQQLVATKLEEPTPIPPKAAEEHHEEPAEPPKAEAPKPDDGTLEIEHAAAEPAAEPKPEEEHEEHPEPEPEPEHGPEPEQEEHKAPEPAPAPEPEPPEPQAPQIHIDEQGGLHNIDQLPSINPIHGSIDPNEHLSSSHTLLQPPAKPPMSGAAVPEDMASSDPLSGGQPEEEPEFASGAPSFMSPASATTAAPVMPFMPASMTPGGAAPSTSMPASAPTPSPVPEPSAPTMPAPVTPATPPAPEPPPPPFTPPAPQPSASAAPLFPSASSPAPSTPLPPSETLSQIEADVSSPHLQPTPAMPNPTPAIPQPMPAVQGTGMPPFEPAPSEPPAPTSTPEPPAAPAADTTGADLESARNAVMQAIAGQAQPPVGTEKSMSLNALPLGDSLHPAGATPAPAAPSTPAMPSVNYDATANPTFTLPDVDDTKDSGPTPPPVPPPMMPPAA